MRDKNSLPIFWPTALILIFGAMLMGSANILEMIKVIGSGAGFTMMICGYIFIAVGIYLSYRYLKYIGVIRLEK